MYFKLRKITFIIVIFQLSLFSCNSENSNDSQEMTTIQEVCNDSIDNDGDGLIDCQDSDCIASANCQEICNDGIDNDGDGFTDCEDLECEDFMDCLIERCIDGIDNDGDGLIDCDDPDCDTNPNCS